MEIILVILIFVFALANANSKNAKKRQAAGQAKTKPVAQGVRPAPVKNRSPRPAKGLDEALPRLNQRLETATAREEPVVRPVRMAEVLQGEPMLRDEECRGGSMAHTHAEGHSALEDEDCVGGSMAHSHTEGVSRADHARHMAAIDAEQGDSDVLPETIDARALRRAVVMAEVLGKPRALRR